MAEQFDGITFEVYISGAWLDISGDVLVDPSPRWNRGIMGTSVLDRVGNPGMLTFSLNNSEGNSGGLLGYYSPGHPNALAGWTSGLPVRLSFLKEGLRRYKFYGRIKPDGIKVIPGQYLERRVDIIVHDYMAQAQIHELQLMTLQQNKTISDSVPYILANMPIQPLATEYNTGSETFVSIFDTTKWNTTATAEFQKLANSELGYIYIKGDNTGGETLAVEGRLTREARTTGVIPKAGSESGFLLKEDGDYLLLESGDKLILDETQDAIFSDAHLYPGTEFGFGRELTNRVEVTTYPRRIDAAATTVLFTLQDSFEMGGNTSKLGYYARYRDPSGGASFVNGIDMVVPTTDDFKAETTGGADATTDITLTTTYGTEGVSYDFLNSSSDTRAVTLLRARGKGVYIYDAVKIVYESSDSQSNHGVHPVVLDMKYQQDPTLGEAFASRMLGRLSDPDWNCERAVIFANRDSMTLMGFLFLEPGLRLTLSEAVTGINRDFFIQGYEAEIFDGKHVWWKPVLQWTQLTTGYWIWDTSAWNQSTVWA